MAAGVHTEVQLTDAKEAPASHISQLVAQWPRVVAFTAGAMALASLHRVTFSVLAVPFAVCASLIRPPLQQAACVLLLVAFLFWAFGPKVAMQCRRVHH